ncbi:MAG: hypothetical protein JWP87_6139 [Labilithrix sp.]|nr:hypothetical protein [Labilithrix sp.]
MSICPICGSEVAPRSANKAFPFCTARCKSIDLGKWLNEEYRVPATPDEAGEGDESEDAPAVASEGDFPGKPDMRH